MGADPRKTDRAPRKWTTPVSIVIPAYNEAGRILPSITKLAGFCQERFERHEIVCVDDGSSDDTWKLFSGLQSEKIIRALRLPQNRGKGCAIQFGMRHARGRLLFFTDADLPYHLSALDAAMEAFCRKDCDLVTGARELSQSRAALPVDPARELASRIFSALVAHLFSLEVRDTQCGFKGFTHAAAQAIFSRIRTRGYVFDVEIFLLAQRLGMKVCRIPVALVQHSGSKISLQRDAAVMLMDLLRLAFRERGSGSNSRERTGP